MSRNGEASIREGGGTKRRKQYQCHFGKHTSKNVPRKVVSKPRFASVDEATLTWLKQQRDAGVLVRGTEVLNAAKKFAQLQGVGKNSGDVGSRISRHKLFFSR